MMERSERRGMYKSDYKDVKESQEVGHVCTSIDCTQTAESLWQAPQSVQGVNVR